MRAFFLTKKWILNSTSRKPALANKEYLSSIA